MNRLSISLIILLLTACSGSSTPPSYAKSTANTSQEQAGLAKYGDYYPNFSVQSAEFNDGVAKIILCFNIPSQDKDWVLGRLPGDVFLKAGSVEVDLYSFSLVSLDNEIESVFARRCDQFEAGLPEQFYIDNASLRVERISASFPSEVNWTRIMQRITEIAPGLVIEPMAEEGGPSFALIEVPPGMTDLEAHNLVVGSVDPVILGPWTIAVEFVQ
jgi:hypothetical protein